MTLTRTLTAERAPAGPEPEHETEPTSASRTPAYDDSHTHAPVKQGTSRLEADKQHDDVLQMWASQYHLPSEEAGAPHGAEVAAKYRPPPNDLQGILTACTVISVWALLFWHALFHVHLPVPGAPADGQPHSNWLHIVAVFFALEFMYTGLFITTHDAMHGTIAMRNRKLNDFLGTLAISCYAWFDYGMLHRNHWLHHNNTGIPHKDPDFHGGNPGIVPWFFRFMAEYSSLWQFTRIAYWAVLMQFLGAPMENIYVYMTAAPILSAFRLFYFGTYVPHHPDPGTDAATKIMAWPLSRTSGVPSLLSFFTCYHFDLHWEHHRWPYAPWWDLPRCRRLANREKGGGPQKP